MSSILQITSNSNPQYRLFQSLLTAKGIKKERQFFIMGEKLIKEFLKDPRLQEKFPVQFVLFKDQLPLDLSFSKLVKKTQLSAELFNQLDALATHYPLLVLGYPSLEEKQMHMRPNGLELICPLGDPKNLGALIRSALSFGVSEVVLTSEATHPYLPQVIKASAGSVLRIKLSQVKQNVSELMVNGDNFALDLDGENIEKINWPSHLRLWVGEEGPGLRLSENQKTKIKKIHIPTENIESLNAMVSATLAIWEWRKSQTNLSL